jgi:hypothetical protein
MKGMLWPDDVPAEIAAQRDGKAPQGPQGPQRTRPRDSKRKTVASAPPSEPKPEPLADEPTTPDARASAENAAMPQQKRDSSKSGKRELPPYLRVVK